LLAIELFLYILISVTSLKLKYNPLNFLIFTDRYSIYNLLNLTLITIYNYGSFVNICGNILWISNYK